MQNLANSDVPIVFISNTGESFYQYVGREENERLRQELIRDMQVIGDRALLYLGSAKLTITSAPVYHLDYLREHLSFHDTQHAYPRQTSPCLSLDIMGDRNLLERIVQYAGKEQTIQLIPHATTPEFYQLVDLLETEFGLTVHLPESPSRADAWIRDYIDSKVGFREFASRTLEDASQSILEGFTCSTTLEAARAAYYFISRDRTCVVKANRGNDALGQTIVKPDQYVSIDLLHEHLRQNAFLADDLIIVEAFAPSTQQVFPSAEFFVPLHGQGEPYLTYICNQIFMKGGTFSGVLVDASLMDEVWYEPLVRTGGAIARKLQSLGYVGHFDLDGIVEDRGSLRLLEVNARRTGGTHIHELAVQLFGSNYNCSLISNTAYSCGSDVSDFPSLLHRLNELLYPMAGKQEGIIITHTSDIREHRFGYIALSASRSLVLDLQRALSERLS